MPAVEFSDFSGGLDLRRDVAMSASNVQAVMRNCYINRAKAISTRPCLTLVTTLEAGTSGLRAAGGKLNTFYGTATTITHANSLFRANKVMHPTVATAVSTVNYAENFNGYLYSSVTYANGDTRHHYQDDPGAWAAATAYTVSTFRRPVSANGFRYEVTAIAGTGTSAATEPVWPTTLGATVIDNPGANQITWTARTFAVVDPNCPNSNIVEKIGQKLYAADGENVAFCAASNPRDWTTVSDAGFIAAGINAAGSDTVTALGEYRGQLSVFFADSLQLWRVDPDPALNVLSETVGNIGTIHRNSLGQISNDLLFLGKQGFRSLSLATLTNNLQENDVGSPIDPVRSDIADDDPLVATYYPTLGQYWAVNGQTAYIYTFSRSNKISAWSIYDFNVVIDAVAVLNNELYIRSGDAVYIVDNTTGGDVGVPPECEVEFFFQDAKSPGVLKMWSGFDALIRGTWEIAFKYDSRHPELVTPYYPISGDLRPGDLFPMELCSVGVAPIFRHQSAEVATIHQLICYFEKLGAV